MTRVTLAALSAGFGLWGRRAREPACRPGWDGGPNPGNPSGGLLMDGGSGMGGSQCP
jgi:hypothetical protein